MQAKMGGAIGRQCARRHGRAEIGAADADVDDVGHRIATRAANGSGAHRLGEGGDFFSHGAYVRHDIPAVDQDRSAVEVAQRHMQRRTVFGQVDLLAGEQRGAALLHSRRAG